MPPLEMDVSLERLPGSWPDEGEQFPPRDAAADRPGEPSEEPATPDDDRSQPLSRSDDSSRDQRDVDVGNDRAEPLRGTEPVVPADTNGSGAAPTVVEPEPEPVDQRPAGPPKRGWWKRLVE